jgi:hypothetical protein
MNRSHPPGPHFVNNNGYAALCELPCRFRTGKTGTNDMNGFHLTRCHLMMHRLMASTLQ